MLHHPRKRFGQHFLKDPGILEKITHCLSLKNTDHVVEIGSGFGVLTTELLKKVNHLDAIELDRDLMSILKKNFHSKKITLHEADALTFNFQTLSQQEHDLRIVGNLPYNISTPLLFKLFDHLHCIQDMYFMLQKEVVLRLTAKPNDEHYGRLSIMSQYFCDNDYLFTVPPTAFDPPPKVYSAFAKLTPKKNRPVVHDIQQFSEVVKEAFNYRRKKLSNALKRLISADQLAALNIDPSARPETLTITEFAEISNILSHAVPSPVKREKVRMRD